MMCLFVCSGTVIIDAIGVISDSPFSLWMVVHDPKLPYSSATSEDNRTCSYRRYEPYTQSVLIMCLSTACRVLYDVQVHCQSPPTTIQSLSSASSGLSSVVVTFGIAVPSLFVVVVVFICLNRRYACISRSQLKERVPVQPPQNITFAPIINANSNNSPVETNELHIWLPSDEPTKMI